jgi:prolyl-tRNA editing enzyme YbaK/EbsC (Cys-tRNA(Pro) deacylase)
LKRKRAIFQSIEAVLHSKGVSFGVIDHSPLVTMDDVVRTLDIPAKAMAKTLLFSLGEGKLVAVVLPGLGKVDYAKVAKTLQVKRQSLCLASEEEVGDAGLFAGAVSPLDSVFHTVVMDSALLAEQMVYCGSGDLSKTIRIAPEKIVEITSAVVADVSK